MSLGFPSGFLNNVLDVQLFELYPLLLYKSPIDVVRYGGEVLYGPIIRAQSFGEPVALGCDLHKHFSVVVFFFCLYLR